MDEELTLIDIFRLKEMARKAAEISAELAGYLARYFAVKYVKTLLTLSAKDMLKYRLAPIGVVFDVYRFNLAQLADIAKSNNKLSDLLKALRREFKISIPDRILEMAKWYDKERYWWFGQQVASYFRKKAEEIKRYFS